MLGNFSIGDYFKQGAVEYAWELSLDGFGFKPEDIWVTVFEGDDELGPRPRRGGDRGMGVGRGPARADRPVPALGELLAGRPDRPLRPVQRAVLRPRPGVGQRRTTCPAARTSASWSTGTSSSCSSTRTRSDTLTPLPAQNIDTGMGLNRMALILQDKPTIFETDQFAPLVDLGEELSGRTYGSDEPTTRALRILADHTPRHDVPHRRRRRALQRGPRLRAAPHHAPRDPAGALARDRAGLPAAVRRRRRGDDGRRVPRAAPRARRDPQVARGRGGGASAARSSRARSCSTRSSSARARRATRASAPRTPSGCTTPTASRST